MKKITLSAFLGVLTILILPSITHAAGISISGGSLKYPGDTSSVTFTASGTTFNAFQGTIANSGMVKITSCSAGNALWVTQPTGTGSFVGALTSSTSSFRIATCSIKATGIGSGSVSVSSVQLANNGAIVGTSGDSKSFNIVRQPTPPGTIVVTSTSHPDQNIAYEATTVVLNWTAPTATTTGYAYLFDTAATTDPGTTITNNNLTATYENQAIGTYYFHIKAKNGDGWGPSTHFKVTIKEPDPKVNDTLAKPRDILITKAGTFTNNIKDGTFSGIIITGETLPNFTANIKLDPMPTLPEGKIFSIKADAAGKFTFTIDFPIPAGRYKLTIQGQDNKILTPLSDEIIFEISQAKGGSINILTDADTLPPVVPKLKWYQKTIQLTKKRVVWAFFLLLALITLAVAAIVLVKKRSLKKLFNQPK